MTNYKKQVNWKFIALVLLISSLALSLLSYIIVMIVAFSLSTGWNSMNPIGFYQLVISSRKVGYLPWVITNIAIIMIVLFWLSLILLAIGFCFAIKANIKINRYWKISLISSLALFGISLILGLSGKPDFWSSVMPAQVYTTRGTIWMNISAYSSEYSSAGIVIVSILSTSCIIPIGSAILALTRPPYEEAILIA